MKNYGEQLDAVLELIEHNIDIANVTAVDEKYRKCLAYEQVERPPLVCQPIFGKRWRLPAPWNEFKIFSYRESFEHPPAMMQNMLLDRVVPGLLIQDDNPLAIRNDHGTIQIASLLGGFWELHGDNYPWVKSLGSTDAIRMLVEDNRPIDWQGGVLSQSTQTLKFYHEKLAQYPKCKQAIQISLPDLQGPMDTADILWGSEIFLAILEEPELVTDLMGKITKTMLDVMNHYRKYAVDHLAPFANTQHGYTIPGRLMIRNDSSIMVSPDTYRQVISPQDAALLKQVGGGSIHFCGNGQHLIESMLNIPDLRGLDFGQAELMDIAHIYKLASAKYVAITCHKPTREDLVSGKAKADFPTGAVFVYNTDTLEDARQLTKEYFGV